MIDTIACPKHGDQPAVPAIDPEARAHGFVVCRSCWYREWLIACLTYGRRRLHSR